MNKPTILNFTYPRSEDKHGKRFQYDSNLNLNITEINHTKIPFVDAPVICTEMYTKTESIREEDEECVQSIEMKTKTFVEREGDDDTYQLLELLTKTKVIRESDDE